MDFGPRRIIPAYLPQLQADGTLDERALRAVIDYVIAGGVNGVFAIVCTGEANAISYEGRC